MAEDIFNHIEDHVKRQNSDNQNNANDQKNADSNQSAKGDEKNQGKDDKQQSDSSTQVDNNDSQQKTEPSKGESELDEEKILSALDSDENLQYKFLSKKLGREIKSFDDLKEEKVVEKPVETEPELPETVKKFWEFTKETGRESMSDFLQANKDWTTESKENVVMEYIRRTQGYEGDELKDYVKYKYFPDEEEATDRERKLAEIDFNGAYNKAVKHLKQEQEAYRVPDKDTSLRREAETQQTQEKEQFSKGMQEAIQSLDQIPITDDFSFKPSGDADVDESYQSLDGILKQFTTENGFDYKGLLKTLYAGKNISKIAKAHADHIVSQMTEDDLKRMSNRKVDTDTKKGAEDTVKANDVLKALNQF